MFRKLLEFLGLALVPLTIGLLVGLAVPVDFIRNRIASAMQETQSHGGHDHDHDHADDGHGGGEADHVELTQTTQAGMGLKTASLQVGNYQSHFELPAFVREIPGASDLHVSSRFSGLVKRVLISEGESLRPGQPMLEIELTGDLLATAQSELLDAWKQIKIVEQEIARLEPTVRGGGVATKRLIESRYERDRLIARVETKSQELLVRGLTQAQIDQITESRKLIRSVTIHVPEDLIPPQLNAESQMHQAPRTFVVEKLNAKPGSMAQAGDNLCQLSFHAVVVVEAQAYEKDLPRIRSAIAEQTPLDLSIGPDGNEEIISGQQIAFLSNHVDEDTNTYPFYVYLMNEQVPGPAGNQRYIAWKWKPGQRAHIDVPDRAFQNELVIPRAALAVDGLSKYVFRWNGIVRHEHDDHDDHDHDDHDHADDDHDHDDDHEDEILDEFQAIEVIVKYMDRHKVVIQPSDDLKVGDRIAINNASQLLFAMQAGDGGGGHTHDH